MKKIDYSKIDNISIANIDGTDYPDFCDAYIESADYDGQPMDDDMLEQINDDASFVHECVYNYIF
jgi:hypothetical protein